MKYFFILMMLCSCIKEPIEEQPKINAEILENLEAFTDAFKEQLLKDGIIDSTDVIDDRDGCIQTNFQSFESFLGDYPNGYDSQVDSFYVRANGFWDGLSTTGISAVTYYQEPNTIESLIEWQYLQCYQFTIGVWVEAPCGASYAIYPYNKPGESNGSVGGARLELLTRARNKIILAVYDPDQSATAFYGELWKKKQ